MNKKLGRLLRPNMGIYLAVMAAFVVMAIAVRQYFLAAIEAAIVIVMFTFFLLSRSDRQRAIRRYVKNAVGEHRAANKAENPFPMLLVRLGDQTVLFANDAFAHAADYREGLSEVTLDQLVPDLDIDWLATGKNECPRDITMNKRRYRVYGSRIRTDDPLGSMLGVLYFADLTELYQVRDEYIRSRPAIAIILVDNYDELTKNLSDSAISTLDAKINEALTQWTEKGHGLLRRMEKNRFLFVMEHQDLQETEEDRFAILESIHQVTDPSGIPVTLSIGVGTEGASFEESYRFAALSIDMALSRGGDQAVVKNRYNFSFYGGKSQENEHRSIVHSRVTASLLQDLIEQSSQVFVMGHKNADLDSVGAAVGICCLCRKKGKPFRIVLDLENNASHRLIDEISAEEAYRDVFISGEEAVLLCDSDSVLVVVDTNRPDQVESLHLLETIHKVCVIDHHRRAADYIDSVVVNLHEPVASSAAELVTEVLQYAVEKTDVLPIEAKALLAGIFLDTKSFHVRTGKRTFDAAAFLRQLGADPVEVKKLLQNDFQDTVAKYNIIKSARLYRQEIAIAALNGPTSRVLAAQAADELLNISGITASIVLFPDGDQVIVSARSIGSANMQVILEPLGGGGNAAIAGAQIKNTTVKEVLDGLVASIEKFYEQ